MPAARRPWAVAVDVVETLVSLDAVAVALEDHGLGPDAGGWLFSRLLRDGFALACSGAYRPFHDVADSALAAMAPALAASQRRAVLAAFSRLDAHADARPALEDLRGAGLRVVALTNGAASTTAALLERTGLDALVPRVISIDEVQAWKPAPAPYLHAAEVLGVEPRRLALMAVHSWDVHGAHRAGLVTGWASRREGVFSAAFDPPDVTGDDLVEVADRLLDLPDDTP
ncbi:MAG: HAD family hydrolase [Acidimicrobiales bacterium]